jgi:hypothetical protein
MAGEYQCRRDDSAVRIAVEVPKAGHTLPCEVVAEDDRGERAVLYSAQFDRDYCPERLERTRADLEGKGWACEKSSDINIVEGFGEIRPPDQLRAEESGPESGPDGVTITDGRLCQLGDGIRRIRIEVEDPLRGKPCSLVYWSETDRSKKGQRLWRAEHDAEFCPNRLGFIVQKWQDEGWRCNVDQGFGQSASLQEAETPPDVSPIPAVATVEAPEPLPSEPAVADVSEPEAADIAKAEVPLPVDALDPKLQAVIEADARRIGEWMEVEPNIEIAAHGDLNADGRDDAVVFLAYQSEQAVYRQYLMSYLVADDTYELAGVKLLTGVNPPPAEARVDQIDDGIIWLSLPSDNGTRQQPMGYVLRDQQLVEIDASEHAKSTSN